jgi:hypothetical protein
VPTILLTPEDPSMDQTDEVDVQIGHGGDPSLGFARVIAQVHTNARVFRGWGPRVLS